VRGSFTAALADEAPASPRAMLNPRKMIRAVAAVILLLFLCCCAIDASSRDENEENWIERVDEVEGHTSNLGQAEPEFAAVRLLIWIGLERKRRSAQGGKQGKEGAVKRDFPRAVALLRGFP
jgi:hypothetical protein